MKRSSNTPLKIYHGVPKGWTKEEILATYSTLGGKNKFDTNEATEPGAPYWMPDRYNWLQYRHTLYEIAKGVQAGDEACIELAIRYIELNYFGSYSGFIRAKLARKLKFQHISIAQQKRLCLHFKSLINQQLCFEEFREYNKLREKWECDKVNHA
ncbi:MAG: hypothetical protein ACRCWR_00325 [Saezia sp.]